MGSVGPGLLPCSWDLVCSALLRLLSPHSQNLEYPAYSAVKLKKNFFLMILVSLFSLSPLSSSPALSGVSLFARFWPSDRLIIEKHAELNVTLQSTASRAV